MITSVADEGGEPLNLQLDFKGRSTRGAFSQLPLHHGPHSTRAKNLGGVISADRRSKHPRDVA
eukprot:3793369-Pyramimonas_sp.AAC.1